MKSKKSTKNANNANNSNTLHKKSNNVYNYCCLFIIFIIIIYNIYKSNKGGNGGNTFNVHKKDNKNNKIQGNRYIESFTSQTELIDSVVITNQNEIKFILHDDFTKFLQDNRQNLINDVLKLYIYIDTKQRESYTVNIMSDLNEWGSTDLYYELDNGDKIPLFIDRGENSIRVPIDDIITYYLEHKEFEATMEIISIGLHIEGDVTIKNTKTVFKKYGLSSLNYNNFKTLFQAKYKEKKDTYIKKLQNATDVYDKLKSDIKSQYESKLIVYGIKYNDKLKDFKNIKLENKDTYDEFDAYFNDEIKDDDTLQHKKLHGTDNLIELDGKLLSMTTAYRKWYSDFKLDIDNYYNIDLKQKYDIIMNKEENIEELKIWTEKPNIIMGSDSTYFNNNVIDVGKFDLITDIEEDINDYADVPNDYTCN